MNMKKGVHAWMELYLFEDGTGTGRGTLAPELAIKVLYGIIKSNDGAQAALAVVKELLVDGASVPTLKVVDHDERRMAPDDPTRRGPVDSILDSWDKGVV